ncbi:MAG: hypothetical protein QM642_03835 [Edaphocola sp.]
MVCRTKKSKIATNIYLRTCFCPIAIAFFHQPAIAQPNGIHNFYLSQTIDKRKDTATSLNALYQYVNGLRQNPANDTLTLHVTALEVHKSKQQALLNSTYTFYWHGKKVMALNGNASLESTAITETAIKELMTNDLSKALQEFDTWWGAHNGRYTGANGGMQVSIRLNNTDANPNLIRYNPNRPLSITDFKGAPDSNNKALAMTYSGIQLSFGVESDDENASGSIEIGAGFDPAKSWMKPLGRNNYVLGHEQLHFDITVLKMFELITLLKATKFNLENFESTIKACKEKYDTETTDLQNQYDTETAHGLNKQQQAEWAKRIKSALVAARSQAGY